MYSKATEGKDLTKYFKELISTLQIPPACQKLMDFKTTNGRGLPWSIKKEISLLFSFMSEGYVFPMPTDHR